MNSQPHWTSLIVVIGLSAIHLLTLSVRAIEPLKGIEIDQAFGLIERNEIIPVSHLCRALISDQTTLRARAAMLLGTSKDSSAIIPLIEALSDMSSHVGASYPAAGMDTTRWWANESLKKLTGKDFGYTWDAAEGDRRKSIDRWRDWHKKETARKETK